MNRRQSNVQWSFTFSRMVHCAKIFPCKYLSCTCNCLFREIYYPRNFLRLQYTDFYPAQNYPDSTSLSVMWFSPVHVDSVDWVIMQLLHLVVSANSATRMFGYGIINVGQYWSIHFQILWYFALFGTHFCIQILYLSQLCINPCLQCIVLLGTIPKDISLYQKRSQTNTTEEGPVGNLPLSWAVLASEVVQKGLNSSLASFHAWDVA